jgi:heterodisulfide reductase subunit A-like polyferredoxin
LGNFQVTLRKTPRFIDPNACTACGDCTEVCPVVLPSEYDVGLTSRKATYKRYAQAIPGGYAITKKGTAPCKATCPAHISVQGYVALAAQGKFLEALKLIKEENPLPAICGRVCHHPCESVCTRAGVDEPVAIDFIKRFVADLDLNSDARYVPEIKEKKEDRIAIVGSGPAGLTCAYYLAIEGYQVTIYEKLPVAGGMLSVGIPEYRLPRDIINAEIQIIKDMGVEIKTGTEIGKDFTIEQLREQGTKAIFLGIGAHECKSLGIEGEDLEAVYPGVDFLREVNLGKKIGLGDRIAVVGGGNVAMDAVRTARRLGASEAFIIYRRSYEEMPANEEEIEECEEEGIQIHTLTNPKRIIGENGRVKAVECIRMTLGEPDESGRRRPVPVEGSEFTMEVDGVIPAIGQESDWACLGPECACTLSDWGTMNVDPLTLQTEDADIFAGGDAVTGPKTVIEAIEAGKQAAISIDRFIRGVNLREGREKEWEAVQDVRTEGYDRIPRTQMPRLSPDKRLDNFDEVQLGFSEAETVAEAKRCVECGICSECYQCVKACKANAVTYETHQEREKTIPVEVGSVVLATGSEVFDPSSYDTYGYKKSKNVLTSLEFERILSATGPFGGHLVRPSDHKEPEKIAWIQCVGSRDVHPGFQSYCSGVCCTYAIKEAIIAKEHQRGKLDTAIFYIDIRTHGKDFEKYYNRAMDAGVRFVKSKISHIIQADDSGNVLIRYTDEIGKRVEEDFDMVILSVGFKVPQETADLAHKLGIELDQYQHALTNSFEPVQTTQPGIFVCGTFEGPKDIPQSVIESSASAAKVGSALAASRGSMIQTKETPKEVDVKGEPPRIGVFVCNCGTNIAGFSDVPAIVEYATSLPGVVYAEQNLFSCSQDTQEKITGVIKEHGLNRVVVAACTPRTHEELFQETVINAGINKHLFEMANIRNQCSWVHSDDKAAATQKAKDLVRMAVSRVSLLEPLYAPEIEVNQSALVMGGGLSGMTAAKNIAEQGYTTYLIEKGNSLGGQALKLHETWQGEDVGKRLSELIHEVESNSKITVLKNAELREVKGFVGNFQTTVETDGKEQLIEHGVAIIATGASEYKPDGYLYGKDPRVLTGLELDRKFIEDTLPFSEINTALFIQCVGSRIPERPYCSKVCCTHSVKNALTLKERKPEMDVFVLYRDMRTYGLREGLYREAREKGVVFIRYDFNKELEVDKEQDNLQVRFTNYLLHREMEISPDLLVLATAIVPPKENPAAQLFKVPLNDDGFFVEAHVKLRPMDFATDGVFVAGLAHSPKPVDEAIAQGLGAASRAVTLLSKEKIFGNAIISEIDRQLCRGCQECLNACPYQAITYLEEQMICQVNAAVCKGCGACSVACPTGAASIYHFNDKEVLSMVEAALD